MNKENEGLTAHVMTWLTPNQKNEIKKIAKDKGMALGTFVRVVLIEKINAEKVA